MSRARAAAVCLLLVFALSQPAPGSAQSAGGTVIANAVTWKVDHKARTITATVRLAFYSRGCVKPGALISCPKTVDPATVQRMVDAIKAYWNGYMYKCYKVIFDIQWRIVQDQSAAAPNEVDVGIDHSPTNVRSQNVAAAGDPTKRASDDPADRVEPRRDPTNPTTWASHGRPGGWAHEFGHVVGLHDNYDPKNPAVPLNGLTDLMHSSLGTVGQEMIDQAVQRSGIKDSDLACDYRVDYKAAQGWTLSGKKCDRPEGEWTLTMGGSGSGVSWSGKMSFTLHGPGLSGQVGGNWHGDIGGGATTEGIWEGKVRFIEGDPPKIEIPSQSPGTVCAGGVCASGTSFGKATLVLEVGKFC